MGEPVPPRRPIAPLPPDAEEVTAFEEEATPATAATAPPAPDSKRATEHGGRKGPEPTRYGDWEKNGIISDF